MTHTLTVNDVCELVNCSLTTPSVWAREGHVDAVKNADGRWMFEPSSVLAYAYRNGHSDRRVGQTYSKPRAGALGPCARCGGSAVDKFRGELLCRDCLCADDPEADTGPPLRRGSNWDRMPAPCAGVNTHEFREAAVATMDRMGIPRIDYLRGGQVRE